MFTRRDLLKKTSQAALVGSLPSSFFAVAAVKKSTRCINVVNFIRAIEPRFKTDLLLPVQKQMEIIVPHKLPATWLLQYDALVSGPYVQYLKDHMAENHEVGFWFEMNEMHCRDAKVDWRGRPGYEWDHLPPVAFTIGYTHEERRKLADCAMHKFKEVFGHYPRSIASWNLDSFTINHIVEHYGADAFAVCRDQIATDGFTIWGAPIAGYYPSKVNCWSPALEKKNQIDVPILRMLGQDPVYYYERGYKLPNGKHIGEPDTMEPVWTSGRSEHFVKAFLDMIVDAPTGQFGYAQLGQENSFPWNQQEAGYAPQMRALAALRTQQKVIVETMGETGRRFKKAFPMTPVQSQVQLVDPFQNTDPAESSIWYQSRYYRVNLHIKGDLPYFRDLTVYSDKNPQPFLNEATRLNDVEQKMPPVLDGYHWRAKNDQQGFPGAGGVFSIDNNQIRLSGKPDVMEEGKAMLVRLPIGDGKVILIKFDEKNILIRTEGMANTQVGLFFFWDGAKSSFSGIDGKRLKFKDHDFEYSIGIEGATPASMDPAKDRDGWYALFKTNLVMQMAQSS